MTHLTYIFAGIVLIAAVLASISIWSPRKLWVKASAIGATAALMGMAYVGLTDLLSKPKPVRMEWALRTVQEAQVLGASAREGEGIFLWLEIRGVPEPRSYRMPWDRKAAEQLQTAMREAQVFYAPPQKAAPNKAVRRNNPMIYRQPG
jgi:hypothetical protein